MATEHIYEFCMVLRMNTDNFSIQLLAYSIL